MYQFFAILPPSSKCEVYIPVVLCVIGGRGVSKSFTKTGLSGHNIHVGMVSGWFMFLYLKLVCGKSSNSSVSVCNHVRRYNL